MKKILSIILILCLSVALLSACGNKDTASDIDTNSQISAENDTTVNSEKVQIDSTAFDEGVILKAEEYTNAKIEELFSKTEKTNVYELTAKLNDKIVQPNGNVVVTFPIPKEYDEALHSIVVFYIDDNYTAELLESQIKENVIEVSLSHFSLYSVSIIDKSIIESVISGIIGKTDKTETSETNSTTTQSNNKNPSSITNSTSQTTNNSDAEAKRKAEEEAKKKAEAEAKAQAECDAKNPLKSLKYEVFYTSYDVSEDGNNLTVRKIEFYKINETKISYSDATISYISSETQTEGTSDILYNGKYYTSKGASGGVGDFTISDTRIYNDSRIFELTLEGNLIVIKSNNPFEKIGAIYKPEK